MHTNHCVIVQSCQNVSSTIMRDHTVRRRFFAYVNIIFVVCWHDSFSDEFLPTKIELFMYFFYVDSF